MLPKSFRYRATIYGAIMQGTTCLRFSHISAHLLLTYRCKVRPKVQSVTKISVQPKAIIKAGTWILIMCWIKGLIMCKSLLFYELKQEETTSFVWKNFLKQEVPPWKGLCNHKGGHNTYAQHFHQYLARTQRGLHRKIIQIWQYHISIFLFTWSSYLTKL